MKIVNRLMTATAFAGLYFMASPVSAQTTYTNVSATNAVYFGTFGSSANRGDVPIVGQIFVAPTGNLLSWTFYNDSAATTGATFGIAAYTMTAGPDLFTATTNILGPDPILAGSGFYAHTISGINLALTAGQAYLAYFTTDNVVSPVMQVTFEAANSAPLGRSLAYSFNTTGAQGAAYNTFASSLVYTATFGAAVTAVPEPASWALMILGFGAVGTGLRRRDKQTARLAHA